MFPVTLIGIGEERDSDGQYGPKVVQEWRFAIDDPTSPFDGQLLFDSWVTAPKDGQVHPKSDHFGYMTALFGGRTAPEGTEIDIETQLVGRQALATVVRNDDGSMRITDLGALPTQAVAAAPVAAAAPAPAPVQQQPSSGRPAAPSRPHSPCVSRWPLPRPKIFHSDGSRTDPVMTAPSTRPTNQDRIRAALWFAERGFGIFPVWSTRDGGTCRCRVGRSCTSPGKHPITNERLQERHEGSQQDHHIPLGCVRPELRHDLP